MGKRSTQLTMKDIARQMGTSVSTVSRALKDSPRISPERRAEIQAFAREHNFIPNALAGTLRHSKVEPQKTIGVVVPEIVHYYFASIISGIVEKASAEGFLVMVNQSCESYEREVTLCNNFYKYKVCGLIVVQAKDTKKYAHFTQYVENDMPIVFCDRICTGVDASRVVVDDYIGAYNAVSHLIETGCKHSLLRLAAVAHDIQEPLQRMERRHAPPRPEGRQQPCLRMRHDGGSRANNPDDT